MEESKYILHFIQNQKNVHGHVFFKFFFGQSYYLLFNLISIYCTHLHYMSQILKWTRLIFKNMLMLLIINNVWF